MPLIIDRHVPLRDGHFAAHGNREPVREQQIGDPHMGIRFADVAQRDHAHAELGLLDLDRGRGNSRMIRVIGMSESIERSRNSLP